MLNPSTADATKNDPTIRRCIGFAQGWGFGRLEVVNLFAYRVSQPQRLWQVSDPIGPENDGYVLRAVQASEMAIAAWGQWGGWQNRDRGVLQLIAQTQLYCLGKTQAGYPRHPLYLKKDLRYMPYVAQDVLSVAKV